MAAYALGNLAACNAENCVSIAKEGGIAVLVHLVQAGAQDAQKDAVKTLGNLALHNAGNSAEIVLVGAIAPIINLLSKGAPEARKFAAAALGKLAFQRCTRLCQCIRR